MKNCTIIKFRLITSISLKFKFNFIVNCYWFLCLACLYICTVWSVRYWFPFHIPLNISQIPNLIVIVIISSSICLLVIEMSYTIHKKEIHGVILALGIWEGKSLAYLNLQASLVGLGFNFYSLCAKNNILLISLVLKIFTIGHLQPKLLLFTLSIKLGTPNYCYSFKILAIFNPTDLNSSNVLKGYA